MKKIVILHTDVAPDAGIDEQDTILQAKTIAEAITSLGYEPVMLPFVMDLNATISKLRALQPCVVFNLVESLGGKGSMVYFSTALLDFLRLPYTGCRTDALYLTSNKPLTKKFLHAEGIPTPPWITTAGIGTGSAPAGTYLMKPSWEDASVGLDDDAIIFMTDQNNIVSALRNRQAEIGSDCFAEAYIEGREFNIALLATDQGVQILPASEILFQDYPPGKLKILDYRAKWVEDSFEYDNTRRTLYIAPEDEPLTGRLRDIALRCWNLFGLRGYARVDFRIDQKGNPYVLEINANPCLSPDAGFAAALDYAGIKYSNAIDDILRDALQP
ncbi:MAG: D-alanine--D-alanine ligase [Deltaproteobacteria bacterium HGW-Deltaproteobacteria-6]|jgi:D-alanine-D-alanine ligase|nr:MAG: D-alanine--D-alanine ligase [Deltaproteobacteria bacterium HGW-Deltaproteobacteria-6]